MRMLRAYIYVSFFIYIHDVRDKQGELKLRDCRYARENRSNDPTMSKILK